MKPSRQLPRTYRLVEPDEHSGQARMWVAPNGAWFREVGEVKDDDRMLPSRAVVKKPKPKKK